MYCCDFIVLLRNAYLHQTSLSKFHILSILYISRKITSVLRYVKEPGERILYSDSLGLDGPGIESQYGRILCTFPDGNRDPLSLLYSRCRVIPGGKAARTWR